MLRPYLVALLIATTAQAQLPPVSERVEVNILEVTVFVRDSAGNPVSGLTADDFELRVDGQRRPITNFYEVNRRAEVSANPAAAPARRDFVALFIDDLHLDQGEKKRALDALRNFVGEHIRRGTAAMLVTSGSDLHIVQRFTEDPAVLIREIDRIEKQPAHVNELEAERAEMQRLIEDARKAVQEQGTGTGRSLSNPDRGAFVRKQIESFARQQRELAESTVAALDQVVHAIEGLDGRRTLVYVSDGLPMQPGAEVFQYFKADEMMAAERKDPRSDKTDPPPDASALGLDRILAQAQPGDAMSTSLNANYIQFARRAALSGVQFFAINARGVQSFERSIGAVTTASHFDSSLTRSNLLGPMRLVADETGGKTVFDTNDMNSAFAELDQDLSNYYSLGFRSEGSDRESDVRVQVKRRGLTVRSVKYVRERNGQQQIADRVRALLYARGEENPLDASVELTPLSGARSGVRAAIRLALDKLSVVPDEPTSFAVYVALLDDKMQEVAVRKFVHRVDPSEPPNSVYRLPIDVPPGKYTISLGISDTYSSQTSYFQRELTIPAPAE